MVEMKTHNLFILPLSIKMIYMILWKHSAEVFISEKLKKIKSVSLKSNLLVIDLEISDLGKEEVTYECNLHY